MAVKACCVCEMFRDELAHFADIVIVKGLELVNVFCPFISFYYQVGEVLVLWRQVAIDAVYGVADVVRAVSR